MNVDISPNRPPISSWTAAAPSGSGSLGGGSSTPSRSMRWIMWAFALGGLGRPPYPSTRCAHGASVPNVTVRRAPRRRPCGSAPRRDDLAPQPEVHAVLAAERDERLEHRLVAAAAGGIERGDHAARHRLDARAARAPPTASSRPAQSCSSQASTPSIVTFMRKRRGVRDGAAEPGRQRGDGRLGHQRDRLVAGAHHVRVAGEQADGAAEVLGHRGGERAVDEPAADRRARRSCAWSPRRRGRPPRRPCSRRGSAASGRRRPRPSAGARRAARSRGRSRPSRRRGRRTKNARSPAAPSAPTSSASTGVTCMPLTGASASCVTVAVTRPRAPRAAPADAPARRATPRGSRCRARCRAACRRGGCTGGARRPRAARRAARSRPASARCGCRS